MVNITTKQKHWRGSGKVDKLSDLGAEPPSIFYKQCWTWKKKKMTRSEPCTLVFIEVSMCEYTFSYNYFKTWYLRI